MFWRLLLLTLGGAAVMLALAYFTAQPERRAEPTVRDVIRLFDRLAFSGFGADAAGGREPYLRRWTRPVRIAVIGVPEGEAAGKGGDTVSWTGAVQRHAQVYDSLPNLEVAVVAEAPFSLASEEVAAAREAANLAVVTVPGGQLEAFIERTGLPREAAAALIDGRQGCTVLGADAAVLSNVVLIVRGNLSADRRGACLGEGMARAMGFFIESEWAGDVFRERRGTVAFHPVGRLAAALVYAPALDPGMGRTEALTAARDVLEERGLRINGGDRP